MIRYVKICIVSLCLLLRAFPVFPDQVIIDSTSQFEFARTCMERGEYEMAVGEFKRFMHFFPDDTRVPTSRRLMGICYMKDQRFDAAREVFFNILKSEPESAEAGKARLLIGESYYLQGIETEAEHYFGQIIEKYPHGDLKNAAFYRLGWTRMESGSWKEASETFRKVEKDSLFYQSSLELADQSLQGEELPYKSPAFAGTAALIPGLGHVYVSRYRDAAVAFLLNGLFIWATVEAFNEDHYTLGGILALVEAGWYAGNIYSAVNCAHKHNRKLKDDFRDGLKDQFDLRLFAGAKGHVGLALTFHF
jgi:tetratricopeptide (TPR) repeat protein